MCLHGDLCWFYVFIYIGAEQNILSQVGGGRRAAEKMPERNITSEVSHGSHKKVLETVSRMQSSFIIVVRKLADTKMNVALLLTYQFYFSRLHASETRQALDKDMQRRELQIHEMEQTLPKANGTYLSIILGSVNVSILNKNDKWVHFVISSTMHSLLDNVLRN